MPLGHRQCFEEAQKTAQALQARQHGFGMGSKPKSTWEPRLLLKDDPFQICRTSNSMNFSATVYTQKLIKSEETSISVPWWSLSELEGCRMFEQRGPMVFGCQRPSDAVSQSHPRDWQERIETAISYSCFSSSASSISRLQPASL